MSRKCIKLKYREGIKNIQKQLHNSKCFSEICVLKSERRVFEPEGFLKALHPFIHTFIMAGEIILKQEYRLWFCIQSFNVSIVYLVQMTIWVKKDPNFLQSFKASWNENLATFLSFLWCG